jgi:hypothetical protein
VKTTHRHEGGFVTLLTTLLLVLLGLFGFAALDTATKDQQVAGFAKRKRLAFYAAEAGVAKALETMTTGTQPAIPTTSLGNAALFPHGQPSFEADSSVPDPIDWIGATAFPGMALNIGQGGMPTYQMSMWRIYVRGRAPGGTVARVETVAGSLVAN